MKKIRMGFILEKVAKTPVFCRVEGLECGPERIYQKCIPLSGVRYKSISQSHENPCGTQNRGRERDYKTCEGTHRKGNEMKLSQSDIDFLIQIVDDALYAHLDKDEYHRTSVDIGEEIKNRLRENISE